MLPFFTAASIILIIVHFQIFLLTFASGLGDGSCYRKKRLKRETGAIPVLFPQL